MLLAFAELTAFKHRTQDFTFILDGFTNILNRQLVAANNILPGSKRSIPYMTETSKG